MACEHKIDLNFKCACCAKPRLVNLVNRSVTRKHGLVTAGNDTCLIVQTGVLDANEHTINDAYVTVWPDVQHPPDLSETPAEPHSESDRVLLYVISIPCDLQENVLD
jgi:hypothetical protein